MTLARDKATPNDVIRLLQRRAAEFAVRPTPEALADSMSCGCFSCGFDDLAYPALCKFRTLRQDARVATARRALATTPPSEAIFFFVMPHPSDDGWSLSPVGVPC